MGVGGRSGRPGRRPSSRPRRSRQRPSAGATRGDTCPDELTAPPSRNKATAPLEMQVSSGSHNVVPEVFPGGFLSTVGSVGGSSRSRMSHRTFRRQDDHAACLPSPCLGSRARRDPVLQRHHGTAGTGPAHPASRSRRCGARSGGRLRLPSLRDSYAPARPQRPASAAHRGVDHADLDRQHGPGHHLARQLHEPASTARSRPLPTCSSSAAPSTSGATTLATRSTRPATRTASRGPSSRAAPTTPGIGCGCAPSTSVTSRW